MVTNDPKAMSFLLMNALVCLVMLDIIVNISASQCLLSPVSWMMMVVVVTVTVLVINKGLTWKVAQEEEEECFEGFKCFSDKGRGQSRKKKKVS